MTSKRPRLKSQRQWRLESVKPWCGSPFYPTWKRRYLSRDVREGDSQGLSEGEWGLWRERTKGGGEKKKNMRKNEKNFSQPTCFSGWFWKVGQNRNPKHQCTHPGSRPPTSLRLPLQTGDATNQQQTFWGLILRDGWRATRFRARGDLGKKIIIKWLVVF